MSKQSLERARRLLPGGVPRHVRCYDNGGESTDRYTAVYSGRYPGRAGLCRYVGMSGLPFHPQGFGQHGESRDVVDYPKYGHLGKKITFADLPADCKKLVVQDYIVLWEIGPTDLLSLLAEIAPDDKLTAPFLYFPEGTPADRARLEIARYCEYAARWYGYKPKGERSHG